MRYQFGVLPDSAQNGHGGRLDGSRSRIAPTPIPNAPSHVASEVDTGSTSPKPSTSHAVTDIPLEPTPKSSRDVNPVADTQAAATQEIREPSTAQDSVRPSASRDELMQQWLATLLKIVEDRTGYPIEMLDPDAILEADLGIDSIKRVEIIAAFRRAELETFPEQPVGLMERLTAARSMRAIVDSAADLIPSLVEIEPIKPAPFATEVQSAQQSLSIELCIDGLIKLVADRTGYPTDMLDPDARLEADLGIDSIKRVEIIAAFRREVLHDARKSSCQSYGAADGGRNDSGHRRMCG